MITLNTKVKKIGATVLILLVSSGIMLLLALNKSKTNTREIEPPVRRVETLVPEFTEIPFYIEGSGLIKSSGSVDLYATASGKVVYSLNNLASGTYVEEGDMLLEVDSRLAQNALFLARAGLVSSVSALMPHLRPESDGYLFEKWNNYLYSLNVNSAVTPEIPELSVARELPLLSSYGIYSSYYTVKDAEINLENHRIIAPFSGYISGEGVIVDSSVSIGQKVLTLVDAGNLKLSIPLTIDDLEMLDSESLPIPVDIYPSINNGTVISGQLVRKDVLMESSSQMVNVFIEFENPELDPRFSPGNYVDVVIQGQTMQNTAAIPRHAVIENNYVYIFDDGILAKKPISIRAVSNDMAYIYNTLPEGTEIVTSILQKPLIGMRLSRIGDESNIEVSDSSNGGENEENS